LSESPGSSRVVLRVGKGAGVAAVTGFIFVLSQVRTQTVVMLRFWPNRWTHVDDGFRFSACIFCRVDYYSSG
jgi:hypothetical protein